jgi:hypothetical protein
MDDKAPVSARKAAVDRVLDRLHGGTSDDEQPLWRRVGHCRYLIANGDCG